MTFQMIYWYLFSLHLLSPQETAWAAATPLFFRMSGSVTFWQLRNNPSKQFWQIT